MSEGCHHAPNSSRRGSPAAGRWFLVFIGVSLAVIGGVFVWLMASSYLRAREMRSWPVVPCVILRSEIETRRHDPHSPMEFRLAVAYGYEWQGRAMSGERFALRGSPWSSKPEPVERRAARFPAGSAATCRVNPARPELAVLEADSLAPGYSIWFPALFVVGGLVMTVRAFAAGRPGHSPANPCQEQKCAA